MERAVAIIQARMSSARLPGKVLKPILGRSMLWHIVQRVAGTPGVEEVVVATSERPADDPIQEFCEESGCPLFRGSEHDVLDRFYQTAARFNADPVIRITADCPFVDPEVVGHLLRLYRTGRYDHVGVATGAGALFLEGGRFPDGLDAECFSFPALEWAWKKATDPSDREHVTPPIWQDPGRFQLGALLSKKDYSHLRWTVDHPTDFHLVSKIYEALYQEDKLFLMKDILRYLQEHPDLAASNQSSIGKEGYQQVWKGGRSKR